MICAKCHRERTKGRSYRFFYGEKGASTTYRDYSRMQKVTSTPYRIVGEKDAWICASCVQGRTAIILTGVLLFTAMLVAAAVGSALEGNTANVLACSGMALITLVASLFQVLTGREEIGERVAITAHRKEPKAQGHNAFLTPGQFQKMQRNGL